MKATTTAVDWDAAANKWHVRIQIGEEVIKRPLAGVDRNASESDLRGKAVAVAKDEGYDVDPAQVAIAR